LDGEVLLLLDEKDAVRLESRRFGLVTPLSTFAIFLIPLYQMGRRKERKKNDAGSAGLNQTWLAPRDTASRVNVVTNRR